MIPPAGGILLAGIFSIWTILPVFTDFPISGISRLLGFPAFWDSARSGIQESGTAQSGIQESGTAQSGILGNSFTPEAGNAPKDKRNQ
jgi:hypothetical protein